MNTCKICERKFKAITNTHLNSAHNVSIAEYKNRFGSRGVGFYKSIHDIPPNDPRYKKWRESLYHRPDVWNKGQTKDSHSGVAKISRTLREKNIDNLAEWRKINQKQTYFEFKKDEDLAFLIGLILGDGHIAQHPRTERLVITLGTDKPALYKYSAKVVEKTFQKQPRVVKRKNEKCMVIDLYEKHIGQRLGVPKGSRHNAKINLPRWVWNEDKFLVACLKGLFEAEGSFSIHKPTYTYNFQFSNKNTFLLDEVEKALKKLNYKPERRIDSVRLRKKHEALDFEKLISFRNYSII